MNSYTYEVYFRPEGCEGAFSPAPFPDDENTKKILAGMSRSSREKMIRQLDGMYSSLMMTAADIIDWRNLVAKSIGAPSTRICHMLTGE